MIKVPSRMVVVNYCSTGTAGGSPFLYVLTVNAIFFFFFLSQIEKATIFLIKLVCICLEFSWVSLEDQSRICLVKCVCNYPIYFTVLIVCDFTLYIEIYICLRTRWFFRE